MKTFNTCFGYVPVMHVACYCMRVLFCSCFVGESALAYDFKSKTHCGNAVRYGRALASVTLTAHHMFVILI